jgi:hypothetical protein
MTESETLTIPDDPFTLLNTIIAILLYPLTLPFTLLQPEQIQMQLLPPQQQSAALPAAMKSVSAVMQTNEERWVWKDCKGREREIIVYRKVINDEAANFK